MTNRLAYVTAPSGVNLRIGPKLDSPVLRVLGYGREVELLGEAPDEGRTWYKVSPTGTQLIGFVASEYVGDRGRRDEIIDALATELAIAPAILRAVVAVESGGSGFVNGRLALRLELHVLRERLQSLFDTTFQIGHPAWLNHRHNGRPYHNDPDAEFAAFEDALKKVTACVYESASYGIGQIMGFNYASAGYASAEAMVEAFTYDEEVQLRAMTTLFRSMVGPDKRTALQCLQEGDLLGFAKLYNGTAQAEHYAERLRKAMS